MQPLTQDQQAETFIGQADRVMRALESGGKDSHQLVLDTRLDAVTVAKAINYLRQQISPPFVETMEINDLLNGRKIVRHSLTEDGRRNLPPPLVPKWNGPDVDPRKKGEQETLAKIKAAIDGHKKSAFGSLKHVEGMSGKVRIDSDGRVQLSGAKGMVLDTIRDYPKITAALLVEKTGLPKQTVWQTCDELVDKDFIEIIKDGNTNQYREVGSTAKPVEQVQHKPVPVVIPSEPVPEPVYKPRDDLTQAVRALLAKHEATDVLLALVSELDAELKLMREFKNRMQTLTGDK
jgi:hypothetical protein